MIILLYSIIGTMPCSKNAGYHRKSVGHMLTLAKKAIAGAGNAYPPEAREYWEGVEKLLLIQKWLEKKKNMRFAYTPSGKTDPNFFSKEEYKRMKRCPKCGDLKVVNSFTLNKGGYHVSTPREHIQTPRNAPTMLGAANTTV